MERECSVKLLLSDTVHNIHKLFNPSTFLPRIASTSAFEEELDRLLALSVLEKPTSMIFHSLPGRSDEVTPERK